MQDIKVMLDNSQIIIGIENEQKELIAFARVLSDFVYKAIKAFSSIWHQSILSKTT